jgi:hypothetical protein
MPTEATEALPVAARAASHSAAPRTGLFEEPRDMLIAGYPQLSPSRPLACGSFRGSPTTPTGGPGLHLCAVAAHITSLAVHLAD